MPATEGSYHSETCLSIFNWQRNFFLAFALLSSGRDLETDINIGVTGRTKAIAVFVSSVGYEHRKRSMRGARTGDAICLRDRVKLTAWAFRPNYGGWAS